MQLYCMWINKTVVRASSNQTLHKGGVFIIVSKLESGCMQVINSIVTGRKKKSNKLVHTFKIHITQSGMASVVSAVQRYSQGGNRVRQLSLNLFKI